MKQIFLPLLLSLGTPHLVTAQTTPAMQWAELMGKLQADAAQRATQQQQVDIAKQRLQVEQQHEQFLEQQGHSAKQAVTRDQSPTLDLKIASEFPELLEDNARVQRGEKPQSELFKRTARIFSELATDDPTMKTSPALVIQAARVARMEIETEAIWKQLEEQMDAAKAQIAALRSTRP